MNIFQLTKIKRFVFTAKCLANRATYSSTSGNLVIVSEDENTRTANIVMNRPPVNSLNMELLRDLTAAIKDLETRKFKGLVISSSSPTVFSSGLDITEMYKPKPDRFRDFWTSLQNFWKTLYLSPLITIAAISGHAPAGGCLIALSCDYKIMTNSKVTIGLNETKLGLTAPIWFQTLLINTIGFRTAEKALNLGTLFTPEEALSIGLVDELASNTDELQAKVKKQMELWLKVPSGARQITKIALRKQFVEALEKYEAQEVDLVFHFANMENTQKALGSYIEGLKSKKP